jgi:hexokinase
MVSGMCKQHAFLAELTTDLGEITRNILLHLIDLSILFDGYSSTIINTHYGYDAAFVSAVEAAKDNAAVQKIIVKDLEMDESKVKESDAEIVRWACSIVAKRAAALAACAIAAVILQTGNEKVPEGGDDAGVDVGVDGRWVVHEQHDID